MNGRKWDKAITSTVVECVEGGEMGGNIRVIVSFRYTQKDKAISIDWL